MIQNLIVALIFVAAVAYVARLVIAAFKLKEPRCASGCGKCGAIDIDRISKKIEQKGTR